MTTPKNLSEWLEYIASIHVSAIDMGLERVLPVAKKLGILKEDLVNQGKTPYIFTVAGTNGKGSTTATIASICQAAGYKTALYQSPHLVDFTERVKIDGKSVDESMLVQAFELVERARLELSLSLSFFEMTTLAAFLLFDQADCDVWVLEIGLGGRLDVVNIIDPDLAVITNVGMDHVDWLGDDLEKIGFEKAGIVRDGIPVILGSRQLPHSVYAVVDNNPSYQLGQDYEYQEQETGWIYSSAALTLNLPKPNLSIMNAATAVSAILASQLTIDEQAICQGVAKVSLAGRFDRRDLHHRHFVFDVAHNEDGIKFLLEQFVGYWQGHQNQHPTAKLHVLFSMLGDKDVAAVLRQVAASQLPINSWHTAAIKHDRAMDLARLLTYMQSFIDMDKVVSYNDLSAATFGVIQDSQPEDLILVFGSFHTIGESLTALCGRGF